MQEALCDLSIQANNFPAFHKKLKLEIVFKLESWPCVISLMRLQLHVILRLIPPCTEAYLAHYKPTVHSIHWQKCEDTSSTKGDIPLVSAVRLPVQRPPAEAGRDTPVC